MIYVPISHLLRRPVLDGDNWWRGHAAAFLKYVNLPPEALRHGRVSQVRKFKYPNVLYNALVIGDTGLPCKKSKRIKFCTKAH